MAGRYTKVIKKTKQKYSQVGVINLLELFHLASNSVYFNKSGVWMQSNLCALVHEYGPGSSYHKL